MQIIPCFAFLAPLLFLHLLYLLLADNKSTGYHLHRRLLKIERHLNQVSTLYKFKVSSSTIKQSMYYISSALSVFEVGMYRLNYYPWLPPNHRKDKIEFDGILVEVLALTVLYNVFKKWGKD
ncbi:hypothetical protein BDC45DRAFT_589885 [Circinella umbellata]|nr:hypothetical protein BDC45DRAFT_589885 [Circinella umbellata]